MTNAQEYIYFSLVSAGASVYLGSIYGCKLDAVCLLCCVFILHRERLHDFRAE